METTCEPSLRGITAAAADLLVACARMNLDGAQAQRIRRAVADGAIEWDSLIKLALDHGVTPLLHRALSRCCPELIPAEVMAKMDRHAQGNARHNLLLMRELLGLLAAMDATGVHVLPYKGPLLALTAYNDLSLRQCGDLDILVPKNDIPAAKAILEQRGYSPAEKMTPAELEAFEASPHEYHYTYHRENPAAMVELHWKVVGRFFSFDPDPLELWNRSTIQQIAGANVRVMQPEDLLLVLCAHGAKHFWSRLTWICDIAQFLKNHPTLDWTAILSRAVKYDAKGMLLLGLLLAEGLLGAKLPDAVMAEVTEANLKQSAEIQGRLFLQGEEPDAVPKGARMQLAEGGLFQSLMFQFRMRDRWTGRLRYCFYRALAPNHMDHSWVQLPKPLGFGYYLVRPLRLFIKYSLKPLGSLAGVRNRPVQTAE